MGGLHSARIEDCVGRGGCHDRSLNVVSVTGPALLLILKTWCRLHARELVSNNEILYSLRSVISVIP